jgi:hypothetical protein
MSKPVIGRDLGKLMGRPPAGGGADPGVGQPVLLGAGVRSLMRGQAASPAKPAVPRWYLFAGDALLIALALITSFTGPHPLSLGREIFCVAVVSLAAVLAVLAIVLPEHQTQPPSGAGAGVMADGESPKKFGEHKANAPGPKQ